MTIHWTDAMNARLDRGYANGDGQETIARDVGVSRSAVITQAMRLKLVKGAPVAPIPAAAPNPTRHREPLPPGHPETWGLLTAGTSLAGEAYAP